MTPASTFIYVLLDPRTGAIRYVGKADNPKKRLNDHLRQCRRGETHRARWLRSLLAEGTRPILEVIDEVAQAEWSAAECAYVTFYKEQGCDLVNATPGGEGMGAGEGHPLFGKTRPPETRAKLSAALKGRKPPPFSAEHCANIGLALKGKLSDVKLACLEKLHVANKGWRPSPEQTARKIAAQLGRKHSPTTIAKMKVAAVGRRVPVMPYEECVAKSKRGWERRRLQACLAEMWA